jgi:hypothetical protein
LRVENLFFNNDKISNNCGTKKFLVMSARRMNRRSYDLNITSGLDKKSLLLHDTDTALKLSTCSLRADGWYMVSTDWMVQTREQTRAC